MMIEMKIIYLMTLFSLFYCIYLKVVINTYEKKLKSADHRIKLLTQKVAGIVASEQARAQLVVVTREEFLKRGNKAELGPIPGG